MYQYGPSIGFMRTLISTPGALRLLAISIVARLPLAMLGIGLLVHSVHLTGSYAEAGVVSGVNAAALGIGGPLLGQLVDRRGQTVVLVGSGAIAGALLCALAALPTGTPFVLLVGIAAAIGLAVPPLGACVRSLLPTLAADSGDARAIYAVEASAVELTWVVGPPVVLGLGALLSSGAALAVAGVVLGAGAAAFASQSASRSWRPERSAHRARGGALRAPAMQTLALVMLAIGVMVGAVEVAAASAASLLGSSTAAGPLLGLWGLGSLAGGVLTARLGGGVRGATGLSLVLAALAAGHLALIGATGSLVALGAVLLVAGTALAPAFASVYAMVDRAAPVGAVTEAFAWLATAMAIGGAIGAAVGGAVADHAGSTAAFALAGGAGVVAALMPILRASTLAEHAAPSPMAQPATGVTLAA
jgi:MFS family permease